MFILLSTLLYMFLCLCMFPTYVFVACNQPPISNLSIIIAPWLVMNFAHTAHFISGYLDLRVDLRWAKEIFDKISFSYSDVNTTKTSFIPLFKWNSILSKIHLLILILLNNYLCLPLLTLLTVSYVFISQFCCCY